MTAYIERAAVTAADLARVAPVLSISDADLARWLGQFFWPFLRILALFAAAPGFSSVAIPARAKVALAFVIAICSSAAR